MKKRKANIKIDIVLNENNIPEEISWKASDSKIDKANAQAFFYLSGTPIQKTHIT